MLNALGIIENLLDGLLPVALRANDQLNDATIIMNLANCCYGPDFVT
jgi:hypothetical protein